MFIKLYLLTTIKLNIANFQAFKHAINKKIIIIIIENFYIVLFSDLHKLIIMMVIVDNFYTVLFSDLHKLTVLYK